MKALRPLTALCKITGVSAGECDIIVTAFDGSTRTIHVTVRG